MVLKGSLKYHRPKYQHTRGSMDERTAFFTAAASCRTDFGSGSEQPCAGRRHRRCTGRNSGYRNQDRRPGPTVHRPGDRKSTRLNSSHVAISYAVFCLKKKKKAVIIN